MKNKVNLQLVKQLVSGVVSLVDGQVDNFKRDWIRTRIDNIILSEKLISLVASGIKIREEEERILIRIENSFFTNKLQAIADNLRNKRQKIHKEIAKLEEEYGVMSLVGYWTGESYLNDWKKALATLRYDKLYTKNDGAYRIVEAEFEMQFLDSSKFPTAEDIQKRYTELKYPNYEAQL